MNIIYKFHFLNGITEINQLFDDILIIWPAPVYTLGKWTIYAGILGREEELTIKRDGQHMREIQQ